MKINIIESDNDILESYSNVTIEELKGITNGTCEEVICNILDKLEFSDRVSTINIVSKKIANLGFATFKFINASKLCKDLIKGNINSQFISKIISANKSIFLESDMLEILSQINGIKIHKIYNDNQFIIIVLQKNI